MTTSRIAGTRFLSSPPAPSVLVQSEIEKNISPLVKLPPLWMHTLAVGCAPDYLSKNADGIRQAWSRIPLPESKGVLLSSAKLGGQIAAFLDTQSPVKSVTTRQIRAELKLIAVTTRVGGGSFKESDPRAHCRMGPRRERPRHNGRQRQTPRA
jgi:hypothetical protein